MNLISCFARLHDVTPLFAFQFKARNQKNNNKEKLKVQVPHKYMQN